MLVKVPSGATPIEDISGLIPKNITTKKELDEVEFANINKAMPKYFLGKITEKKAPFTLSWLYQVHRGMYGEVWEWAGVRRNTDLNLGTPPHQIDVSLQQLLDNFKYWETSQTMEPVEIAVRLHHGLVKIHPFKNGNGRWARFIANIYLRKTGLPLPHWPEEDLREDSKFRKEYIEALQKADRGDLQNLIELHKRYL